MIYGRTIGSVSNWGLPQTKSVVLDSALFTLTKETGLVLKKNVDK